MNAAESLDDCWNRIGVRGDRTCPQLASHVHCRNCQVHSAAARLLFDKPFSDEQLDALTERFAAPVAESEARTESVLIFRSGEEWLAIPTALCVEVAGHRTIHSLPHRRSTAVLGLANVRGELMVCVSLSALLGTRPANEERDNAPARLLILAAQPSPIAAEVDEVFGIHRFSKLELTKVSSTLAAGANRRLQGTLQWRERTVGVLEETSLLSALIRSLA